MVYETEPEAITGTQAAIERRALEAIRDASSDFTTGWVPSPRL